MYSYTIKFIALEKSVYFDFKSKSEIHVQEFVDGILKPFVKFDDNEKPIIDSLQTMTVKLKNELISFLSNYRKEIPRINAVISFVNKIQENEEFFFVPNIKLEQSEEIKIYNYLFASNQGEEFEKIDNKMNELFAKVLENYRVNVVGDRRLNIGEPKKELRTCRFCKKGVPETTFNNKAHAISEGLGNKTLVLFDECDRCNSRFSETIEPHMIEYVSLFRTMFDVKGKGGLKKFEGSNFKMEKKDTLYIHFNSEEDRPNTDIKNSYNIRLESKNPIVLQDIYRTFCKFFLSVIDSDELSHFENTIDWVNGDNFEKNLPPIAEMMSYHSFSLQPKLMYYIRKNDNTELPYAVGEFYFTNKVFVFIVPFSSEDDRSFIQPEEYDVFWNTFKHFAKTEDWNFNDYNSQTAKQFILKLNMEVSGDSKTEDDE